MLHRGNGHNTQAGVTYELPRSLLKKARSLWRVCRLCVR